MQPLFQGDMIYWGLIVVALPLLFKVVWCFNDAYYEISSKKFGGELKLPPGHMGLPLIGETFKFLWYFKFLGRPKGWQVAVWLRSLHVDPKNFQDPSCFKPGSFQPFGGGPRICAGNMLVRVQLTIMLHHLALNYRWELINPDAKIKYLPHPKPEDGAIMSFTKL